MNKIASLKMKVQKIKNKINKKCISQYSSVPSIQMFLTLPSENRDPVTEKKFCQTVSGKDFTVCMHAKLLQSCLTLGDPMDCIWPGSTVLRILLARVMEWVVISSSREAPL